MDPRRARERRTTTPAEIAAHFDATWTVPVAETQAFFGSLRAQFPDAVVLDVVTMTPVQAVVVIDDEGSGPPYGYLSLRARHAAPQGIVQFGVSNFSGELQYPA
ncbi:MAG TPA: hypothetical protein VIZ64_09235, partial [Dokdonella sp.]